MDHVTAAHTACDAIIHFGPACLSRDTRTSIARVDLCEPKTQTVAHLSCSPCCTCESLSSRSAPTPIDSHDSPPSAAPAPAARVARVPVYYCFERVQLPTEQLLSSFCSCFPDRDAPVILVSDLQLHAATGSKDQSSSIFFELFI